MDMKVRIKKLDPRAVMPAKARPGDAGLDLTAVSMDVDKYGNYVYGFGIAMEIPKGYVGLVFPRGSIHKKDQSLSNSVGVVDSGCRDEVKAVFKRTVMNRLYARQAHTYLPGERIAQLMVIPVPEVEVEEADELSDSDRGDGGFGSTGK